MNDLISREALKKAIVLNRDIDRNAVCDVLDIIDNAPTVLHDNYSMGYQDGVRKVLSERPQGEWEEPFEMNGKSYHKCTNCHISSELILFGNYCPNCGAEMKGEEE